jgi:hypothetical protein
MFLICNFVGGLVNMAMYRRFIENGIITDNMH